jgi:hypothetical protein
MRDYKVIIKLLICSSNRTIYFHICNSRLLEGIIDHVMSLHKDLVSHSTIIINGTVYLLYQVDSIIKVDLII